MVAAAPARRCEVGRDIVSDPPADAAGELYARLHMGLDARGLI
jgi:hypothetical protein